MVFGLIGEALFLDHLGFLISFIITTGFFTGFYVVPLFTLLQDRAPKSSKGDVIATSNLINVTGAILASFLFFIIPVGFVTAFVLVYPMIVISLPPKGQILRVIIIVITNKV